MHIITFIALVINERIARYTQITIDYEMNGKVAIHQFISDILFAVVVATAATAAAAVALLLLTIWLQTFVDFCRTLMLSYLLAWLSFATHSIRVRIQCI